MCSCGVGPDDVTQVLIDVGVLPRVKKILQSDVISIRLQKETIWFTSNITGSASNSTQVNFALHYLK